VAAFAFGELATGYYLAGFQPAKAPPFHARTASQAAMDRN